MLKSLRFPSINVNLFSSFKTEVKSAGKEWREMSSGEKLLSLGELSAAWKNFPEVKKNELRGLINQFQPLPQEPWGEKNWVASYQDGSMAWIRQNNDNSLTAYISTGSDKFPGAVLREITLDGSAAAVMQEALDNVPCHRPERMLDSGHVRNGYLRVIAAEGQAVVKESALSNNARKEMLLALDEALSATTTPSDLTSPREHTIEGLWIDVKRNLPNKGKHDSPCKIFIEGTQLTDESRKILAECIYNKDCLPTQAQLNKIITSQCEVNDCSPLFLDALQSPEAMKALLASQSQTLILDSRTHTCATEDIVKNLINLNELNSVADIPDVIAKLRGRCINISSDRRKPQTWHSVVTYSEPLCELGGQPKVGVAVSRTAFSVDKSVALPPLSASEKSKDFMDVLSLEFSGAVYWPD